MNESIPKVSVLMSVYNGQDYLQEAIESILCQTFEDFEFLIIDDFSTDDSWKILSSYARQDQRITLIKNSENLGLTKSLNKGLKLVKGKYIARQDADDVSLPQRLERQVAVLDDNEFCMLVSCDLQHINEQGVVVENVQRTCGTELVPWYLIFYNRIAGHSQVMYRRETVLSVNGYDEKRRYSQDYGLWSRLIGLGCFVILPETLLLQRRHGKSISSSKTEEQKSLSLSQTRSNISQLLSKEISLEEAAVLRGFWQGHWMHHRFPQHHFLPFVDFTLRQLAENFINRKTSYPVDRSQLSKQIHKAISKQYICWLQSPLTSRHSVWSKVQVARYALAWSPYQVPQAWLIWILRFPLDTAISIFNKLLPEIHYKNDLNAET